mmetsp:Transcript_29181/g.46859  ORF Transcript_29181/g.46859 Transcript_29181/m.46859 type:complete len:124 (-) Transcript_29181:439-810(-)
MKKSFHQSGEGIAKINYSCLASSLYENDRCIPTSRKTTVSQTVACRSRTDTVLSTDSHGIIILSHYSVTFLGSLSSYQHRTSCTVPAVRTSCIASPPSASFLSFFSSPLPPIFVVTACWIPDG